MRQTEKKKNNVVKKNKSDQDKTKTEEEKSSEDQKVTETKADEKEQEVKEKEDQEDDKNDKSKEKKDDSKKPINVTKIKFTQVQGENKLPKVKSIKKEELKEDDGVPDVAALKQKQLDATLTKSELTDPAITLLSGNLFQTTKFLTTKNDDELKAGIILDPDDTINTWNLDSTNKSVFKLIEGVIPSLAKFQVTKNSNLDGLNPEDNKFTDSRNIQSNPLARKALELVDVGTAVTRYVLDTSFGLVPLPDMNETPKEAEGLVPVTTIKGAQNNQSKRVNTIVGRLLNYAKTLSSVRKVVLATPPKFVQSGSEVHDNTAPIFDIKHTVIDNPHVYYATPLVQIPWMKNELLDAYGVAPPMFGELGMPVSNRYGVKMTSDWGLSLDQYSAEILNINAHELEMKTMSSELWYRMVQACNMNMVSTIQLARGLTEEFPVLQTPSQEELNMFWLYMMISKEAKINMINFLSEQISNTNRLSSITIDQVFNFTIRPARKHHLEYHKELNMIYATGKEMDPSRLLVLETFANMVDVDLGPMRAITGAGGLLQLAGLLSWFVACPRLAVSIKNELGFYILKCLSNMYGTLVSNTFLDEHGWYKEFRDNRWIKIPNNGTLYRTSFSADTTESSLFVPFDIPGHLNRRAKGTKLLELIAAIRQFTEIEFHPVNLDLKRQAEVFPYTFEDFTAQMSWTPYQLMDLVDGQETPVKAKFNRMVAILTSANSLWEESQGTGFLTSETNDWYVQFTSTLEEAAKELPNLLNVTCADMQQWIMNGPLFTHDYIRHDRPTAHPHEYAIGVSPLNPQDLDENVTAPLIIDKPTVRIDSMYPFIFLMCAQGDLDRKAKYSQMVSMQGKPAHPEINKEIMDTDPLIILNVFYQLVRSAGQISLAFSTLQSLAFPYAQNNPLGEIAGEIRTKLRVGTWNNIVEAVFKAVSAGDYTSFIDPFKRNGVVDMRNIVPRIVQYNKLHTKLTIPVNDMGSRIGQGHEIIDAFDRQRMMLISKLYISENSPFSNLVRGVYIGNMANDHRDPVLTADQVRAEYPVTIEWDDITFTTIQEGGLGLAVTLGRYGQIVDPYRIAVGGRRKVVIELDHLSQIPDFAKPWFVKALTRHQIMLHVKQKLVRYIQHDHFTRDDYLDENMTTEDLVSIMNQEDGAELVHVFENTRYATNFSSNKYIVRGYLQWIAIPEIPHDNVVTAVIPSTHIAPDNHVPILPSMWGFGTYEGYNGYMPITNEPKIASSMLNFNNKVKTFSSAYFDSIPQIHKVSRDFTV